MRLIDIVRKNKDELVGKRIRQVDWEPGFYIKVQFVDEKSIFGFDPLNEATCLNLKEKLIAEAEFEFVTEQDFDFVHEFWDEIDTTSDSRMYKKILTRSDWEIFKNKRDLMHINTAVVDRKGYIW